MGHWYLSPNRRLTEEEQALVWQKPASHVESDAERRICDAVKRNWNRGEMKLQTFCWKVTQVPERHSLPKLFLPTSAYHTQKSPALQIWINRTF